MKTHSKAALGALFSLSLALPAGAQDNTPPPEIRINKVDVQLVPAPDYGGAGNFRRSRDAAPWLQIEVEFDVRIPGASATSPKFLDELTASYYVAFMPDNLADGARNPAAGKAFTLDVTHVDVKNSVPGQSRYSVAYLPGRVIERLTGGRSFLPSNVNVAVELKTKGATAPLAVRAEGPLKNTEGWWKQVDHLPGVLLSKDQTPFAPLGWDRHEPARPAAAR